MSNLLKMFLSPTYCLKSLRTFGNIKKLKKWGHNISYVSDSLSLIGSPYIGIGDNCSLGQNFRAHAWAFYQGESTGYNPSLNIGNDVYFGSDCYVSCLNSISIGEGSTFGDNVLINDNLHGNPNLIYEESKIHPMERKLYSKGPIIIGKNVWVGKNSCILGNVTIGDGAIIGAGSVVTHNVEPNSVYAGVPARKIK